MFGSHSKEGYSEIAKGIKIKTLVYGKDLLMTEFLMDKGALIQEHFHLHEQSGYLIKGKIRGSSGKCVV